MEPEDDIFWCTFSSDHDGNTLDKRIGESSIHVKLIKEEDNRQENSMALDELGDKEEKSPMLPRVSRENSQGMCHREDVAEDRKGSKRHEYSSQDR